MNTCQTRSGSLPPHTEDTGTVLASGSPVSPGGHWIIVYKTPICILGNHQASVEVLACLNKTLSLPSPFSAPLLPLPFHSQVCTYVCTLKVKVQLIILCFESQLYYTLITWFKFGVAGSHANYTGFSTCDSLPSQNLLTWLIAECPHTNAHSLLPHLAVGGEGWHPRHIRQQTPTV